MPVTWLFQVKKFHVSWHFHQIPMFRLLLGFQTSENLVYVLWVWVTSVFPHSLYMQVLKQFKVGEGLGLRVYRYNHFWRNTQNPRRAIKLQHLRSSTRNHITMLMLQKCVHIHSTQNWPNHSTLHASQKLIISPFTWTDRFSSVVSDSLQPHGLQHARLPCPSPAPGAYSNSCPLSQWCHPTISSSVVHFSCCLQSFPASGSIPMSRFFASGSQSIGVSASSSVLPMNIQDWSPLGWTGWISLQSKELPRVYSNTTVQKHQFFSAQLSL